MFFKQIIASFGMLAVVKVKADFPAYGAPAAPSGGYGGGGGQVHKHVFVHVAPEGKFMNDNKCFIWNTY